MLRLQAAAWLRWYRKLTALVDSSCPKPRHSSRGSTVRVSGLAVSPRHRGWRARDHEERTTRVGGTWGERCARRSPWLRGRSTEHAPPRHLPLAEENKRADPAAL